MQIKPIRFRSHLRPKKYTSIGSKCNQIAQQLAILTFTVFLLLVLIDLRLLVEQPTHAATALLLRPPPAVIVLVLCQNGALSVYQKIIEIYKCWIWIGSP